MGWFSAPQAFAIASVFLHSLDGVPPKNVFRKKAPGGKGENSGLSHAFLLEYLSWCISMCHAASRRREFSQRK